MRRRVVLVLLLLVAGGALVNVAVAWVLVQFTREYRAHPVFVWMSDAHPSPIHESDRELLTELGWRQIPISGRTIDVKLHLTVMMATGVSMRLITEEESWQYGSTGGVSNRTALAISSAGWPLFSLQGLRFDASSPSARVAGGRSVWEHRSAIVRPDADRRYFGDQIIPLGPIWPGFAINTVFYAA